MRFWWLENLNKIKGKARRPCFLLLQLWTTTLNLAFRNSQAQCVPEC
jgi:hypothetical protein